MPQTKKTCMRCKVPIHDSELHKIVIYVVQERFREYHYEHVECPGRFTV